MIQKLSEAIRLGAMMRPQGVVLFIDEVRNTSCALGAAMEASGLEGFQYIDLRHRYPILTQWEHCPECRLSGLVEGIIASCLNDDHRWTRERIADFVESLEPKDLPVEAVPSLGELVTR